MQGDDSVVLYDKSEAVSPRSGLRQTPDCLEVSPKANMPTKARYKHRKTQFRFYHKKIDLQ
jgi:hypothetical protein